MLVPRSAAQACRDKHVSIMPDQVAAFIKDPTSMLVDDAERPPTTETKALMGLASHADDDYGEGKC